MYFLKEALFFNFKHYHVKPTDVVLSLFYFITFCFCIIDKFKFIMIVLFAIFFIIF
uniref:Uncharacterized protein n=1 Tax=Ciona intestinalis TaxID=7719 RepID=F6ZCW1_CIOIN